MTRQRLARGALTGLHLLTLAILVGLFAEVVWWSVERRWWPLLSICGLAFPWALGWWGEIWRDLRNTEQPLP